MEHKAEPLCSLIPGSEGLPGHIDVDVMEDNFRCGEEPVSYEVARRTCIRKFLHVLEACARKNQKFTDPEFDLASDFQKPKDKQGCIHGLPIPKKKVPKKSASVSSKSEHNNDRWGGNYHDNDNDIENDNDNDSDNGSWGASAPGQPRGASNSAPGSVHRVHNILRNPSFAPGASSNNGAELQRELDGPGHHSWVVNAIQELRVSNVNFYLPGAFAIGMASALPLPYWFAIVMLLVYCCLGAYRARDSRVRFDASRIQQSKHLGKCWWIAAVATLSTRRDLMQKVCVAWDMDKGVFGFVFYREGSWTYTIIDDYLYLRVPNWAVQDSDGDTVLQEESYKTTFQQGAQALYFASCRTTQHVWFPLLEKAYAKVHGDYNALDGGCSSMVWEDPTGGVGSDLRTDRIVDKDALWKELCRKNRRLIHGLSVISYSRQDSWHGLTNDHSYSIEGAFVYIQLGGYGLRKSRLLKIRNPWGSNNGLWQGDWGVSSDKWSLLSCWWLGNTVQEDGVFFMTFDDVLRHFDLIHRATAFDEYIWNVKQAWAEVDVGQTPQYNAVYFQIHLSKASTVTLALSQLESRYFLALRGKHEFRLGFTLATEGPHREYIAKAPDPSDPTNHPPCANRTVSLQQYLEAGVYDVLVKITAEQRYTAANGDGQWTAREVVEMSPATDKLRQITRNYDVAHQKLVRPHARMADHERWQAEHGVGLRVFVQETELRVEVRCSQEAKDFDDKALFVEQAEQILREWGEGDGGGGRCGANDGEGPLDEDGGVAQNDRKDSLLDIEAEDDGCCWGQAVW